MYTLLLDNDNSFSQTNRQVLMQRSSLVDSLHILVPYLYNDLDMREFTCTMEYVKPISKKYTTETLVPEEELYKTDYIEYKIPLTSKLSEENGNIELQLTFTKVELDEDGNKKLYDRKTQPTTVTITPITNWSDLITDEALTALDNRLLAIDGQIKAINELQGDINTRIPNDLALTDDTLQLTIDGEVTGEGVKLLTIDEEIAQDDAEDGNNDGIIQLQPVEDENGTDNNDSSNETGVDDISSGNTNTDTDIDNTDNNVNTSDNSTGEESAENTEENSSSDTNNTDTTEENTKSSEEKDMESSDNSSETTET
jgi:hypothetical protein